MKDVEKQHIELHCTRLVNRFSCYNDNQEYAALSDLFTADGRFARPTDPDNYVTGRDEIRAAFEARPRDRITRHIISNIMIDVIDAANATGTCYATLFHAPADAEPAAFGVKANASQLLGEFSMVFVLTDAGWKIASQTGRIIFTT